MTHTKPNFKIQLVQIAAKAHSVLAMVLQSARSMMSIDINKCESTKQTGVIMNSDKEKSMNKGDRSDSSSKVKSQPNEKFDKNQSDYKDDGTQQSSESGQSKFGKQSQTDDKNKKH